MGVTLKDIAKLAGVSQPVVSAVLNKTGGSVRVSDAKRKKILELAEELGYVPNFAARKLRGVRTPTIGIIGGGLDSPMQTVLLSRLMSEFSAKGFFVLLGNTGKQHGHAALRELLSRGIDGVVLIGEQSKETLNMLDLPCVLLRSYAPDHPFDYDVDAFDGIYQAVFHLTSHGHRKIISISPGYKNMSRAMSQLGKSKSAGALKAMADAGLPSENLALWNFYDGSGGDDLLKLIRNDGYTAGFTGNDFMAGRTMSFLKANGINVPENFALIGYNGSAFTEFTSPTLTTVVQPLYELAVNAAVLLVERINSNIKGVKDCRSEFIKPCLHIGGSCGCEAGNGNQLIIPQHESLTLEQLS